MSLLGTDVEKCKKWIVGVYSTVSLTIMDGGQNRVKIGQNLQPCFMKKSSVARKYM